MIGWLTLGVLLTLTALGLSPGALFAASNGGVGLGLYLCRLVAQAHGGSLTLRNAAPGLEALVHLPQDRPSVPHATA
ncbi:MAG: hypothetical protein K9K38_13075 [Rhodoferax sp.]|nr:hypothetical protein [Rhodoferax sp.]